jgi:hypothetical protein
MGIILIVKHIIIRVVVLTVLGLASVPDKVFPADAGDTAASPIPPQNPPQNESQKPVRDKVTYESLSLELALTIKMIADEKFLRGETLQAQDQYNKALDVLKALSIDPKNLTSSQLITKALIQKDAGYRQALLKRGLSFWGGYRSNTPSIPILHLQMMEDLLKDFEKTAIEIDSSTGRIENDEKEANRLRGMAQEIGGRIVGEGVKRSQALIEIKEQRRKGQVSLSRVEDLRQQRVYLEKKSALLEAENKELNAATTKLLVNGAASAIGMPPGVVSALESGDLKAAAIASFSEALTTPELKTVIDRLPEDAAKLAKVYQDAERTANDLQRYKQQFEDVGSIIRNPTMENVSRVGNIVYAKLSIKDQARWKGVVEQTKPFIGVVNLVSNPKILEEEITKEVKDRLLIRAEAYLASTPLIIPKLKEITLPFIKAKSASLGKMYAEVYRDLGTADLSKFQTADLEKILDGVARSWPEEFLALLTNDGKGRLREVFQVTTDAALLDRIRETGTKSLNCIHITSVSNDQGASNVMVRISKSMLGFGTVQTIDFKRILSTARQEKIVQKGQALEARVQDVFEEWANGEANLRKALLHHISYRNDRATTTLVSLTQNLSAENKTIQGDGWDSVIYGAASSTSQQDTDKLLGALAMQQVGAVAASEHFDQKANHAGDERSQKETGIGPSPEQPPPPTTANPVDPATQAALTAALNAAFPGAGVALAIAQSFATADANREEQNRLAQERVRLITEEAHLITAFAETLHQDALAEKEVELAEVLRDAAKAQFETYQVGIQQAFRNQALQRARIAIRRSLVFYVAERLREEFDLFDRAMALWLGEDATTGNTIERLIKSDPQQVRLALDGEIHLYDWLNRERESTKTDADALMIHWRKLIRLAKDVCHRGSCQPGDGHLGQIQQTPLLPLSDLIGRTEFARFKAWQLNPAGQFITTFILHPSLGHAPSAYENLRIIDIRLGGKDKERDLLLPQLTLRHSGVSTIPQLSGFSSTSMGFKNEVMLSRSSSSFNWPDPFDLEKLRTRWAGPSKPTPRFFEGYGLYSTYQLTLEATAENSLTKDVYLRFAYFYKDSSNILSESDYLRMMTNQLSDGDLSITDNSGKEVAGIDKESILDWKAKVSDKDPPEYISIPGMVAATIVSCNKDCKNRPEDSSNRLKIVRQCKPQAELETILEAHIRGQLRNSANRSGYLDFDLGDSKIEMESKSIAKAKAAQLSKASVCNPEVIYPPTSK